MNEIRTMMQGQPHKPKILIVDDDAAMLASLRMLLKANGHDVEPAQGGGKALELLRDQSYDLMLLDLQMPGVSGHEVLRHLRQNGIDTKVIVVSGETSFASVKDALISNGVEFHILSGDDRRLGRLRIVALEPHDVPQE